MEGFPGLPIFRAEHEFSAISEYLPRRVLRRDRDNIVDTGRALATLPLPFSLHLLHLSSAVDHRLDVLRL